MDKKRITSHEKISCFGDKKYFEKHTLEFLHSGFERQCWLAGLVLPGESRPVSIGRVAGYLGVCERTARRWLDNEVDPHPCATRLLLARWSGVPPSGEWHGWRVVSDTLVSPSGFVIGPDVEQRFNYLLNQLAIERQRAGKYAQALSAQNRLNADDAIIKLTRAVKLIAEVVG